MVIISAGLGVLINTLIARGAGINEYVSCSNASAFTPLRVPIFTRSKWEDLYTKTPGSLLPAATLAVVYNVNWAYITGYISSNPGAASSGFQRECV